MIKGYDSEKFSINPIETIYRGIKYRSRVEARWAVFFHELGIPVEYEKEGYVLSDGTRYLPDFWLPTWNTFFEVKGAIPSIEEQRKCLLLSRGTQKSVFLAWGAVSLERHNIIRSFPLTEITDNNPELRIRSFASCRHGCRGVWYIYSDCHYKWKMGGPIGPHDCGDNDKFSIEQNAHVGKAYSKASSIRFEYGEASEDNYVEIFNPPQIEREPLF